MSLLIASVVENSHILAGINFIFLKECHRANLTSFQCQIWTGQRDRESNYQLRPILALFCKLVPLILGQNCVKNRTNIVKDMKFDRVCGEFEERNNHSQNI